MSVPQGRPGKRILLVDDDPGVREAIKLLLSLDRHSVSEAANGREALKLFAAEPFDLVITDYWMPGMYGDELASTIKRVAPSQPILMVTASRESVRNVTPPADAVLGKPFNVDELRRVVSAPLPSAEARRTGSAENSPDSIEETVAMTRVLNHVLEEDQTLLEHHWGLNE